MDLCRPIVKRPLTQYLDQGHKIKSVSPTEMYNTYADARGDANPDPE